MSSAQLLDGKSLAASIKANLAQRTTALTAKGITPGLGTILVGDDPGSHSYVSGKHRDCQEVGINSIRIDFISLIHPIIAHFQLRIIWI